MSAPVAPDAGRPEFSRRIDIREIGDKPVRLVATPAECVALARRLGIVAMTRLDAEVVLAMEGAIVTATGTFAADIVQSCAVSAEDLAVHIAEPVTIRFVPARTVPRSDAEIELTADDCDEVGYTGTAFDLGEEIAQSLAVAINPFLTGPMAEAARQQAGLDQGGSGPFAALLALKTPN